MITLLVALSANQALMLTHKSSRESVFAQIADAAKSGQTVVTIEILCPHLSYLKKYGYRLRPRCRFLPYAKDCFEWACIVMWGKEK